MLCYRFTLTVEDKGADLAGAVTVKSAGRLNPAELAAETSLESVLSETLTRELRAAVAELAERARPVITAAEEREGDRQQGSLFGKGGAGA